MNAKKQLYAGRFAAELFGLKNPTVDLNSKQRALWRSEMRSPAQRRRLVGHTLPRKNRGVSKPQPIAPVQSAARKARQLKRQRQEL